MWGSESKKKGIRLADILTIVSVSLLAVKAAANGWLSIEWAAILLVLVVVALVIRINAFKVFVAGSSLFVFIASYAMNDQEFWALAIMLGALIMALIGLYIMLKGIFRS